MIQDISKSPVKPWELYIKPDNPDKTEAIGKGSELLCFPVLISFGSLEFDPLSHSSVWLNQSLFDCV